MAASVTPQTLQSARGEGHSWATAQKATLMGHRPKFPIDSSSLRRGLRKHFTAERWPPLLNACASSMVGKRIIGPGEVTVRQRVDFPRNIARR